MPTTSAAPLLRLLLWPSCSGPQVDATWVLWKNGEEAERRFFPMQRR